MQSSKFEEALTVWVSVIILYVYALIRDKISYIDACKMFKIAIGVLHLCMLTVPFFEREVSLFCWKLGNMDMAWQWMIISY